MPKKRVFSRQLWLQDRGYKKDLADFFDWTEFCDGLTLAEIEKIDKAHMSSKDFDDYDLEHCFMEVEA